ncbi:DNA mismatch repair endonuclease MutL [Salsuginibacillus kocurii]|uniref:DNA mismatch repair endonuclease MutL n=1 Tax=Salsuginibacillus kocurii TaxID=427078 RepID=UPI0003757412|nr:DNA mismatch repair endonuclease MutL [Salsuginibacillus kocurii]
MGRVVQLETHLANKIAAGEVVERPASVVKELVENAVDAHSTRIEIDVSEGGIERIRVLDDGEGLTAEDAKRAFSRHATSKIQTEEDLFTIATLGFRGEALPSIAAVSQLSIETGTGEGPGTLLRYQGGHLIAESQTKQRQGTDIEVTDLFFNTPARLKHMKTVSTELGRITDVVNRQALAHPEISFRLVHNERDMLFTSGNNDVRAVAASIYGRQTAKKMRAVEVETPDFKVEGYVGLPEVNRASRSYTSTIINGRYIKHFPIFKAIEKGYHTLLPIGRFPIAILHITMHPSLIDVNVHPAKLEVRLSKEEELNKAVYQAIRQTLQNETLIPNTGGEEAAKKAAAPSEQLPFSFPKEPVKTSPAQQEAASSQELIKETKEREEPEVRLASTPPVQEEQSEGLAYEQSLPPYETKAAATHTQQKTSLGVPDMEVIGQMHGTYIFAQNDEGLYMIDQHAAEERLQYEYFREKVGEESNQAQELLFPFTLEVSTDEAILLEQRLDDLQNLGIAVEPFGTTTYRVTSYPKWMPAGSEEEMVREIVDEVLHERSIKLKALRENSAILMACKAAIKANRYLRKDEMEQLLYRLQQSEDPYTCPHGRPIIIHFSTKDMEKMFKRIMN